MGMMPEEIGIHKDICTHFIGGVERKQDPLCLLRKTWRQRMGVAINEMEFPNTSPRERFVPVLYAPP